MSRRLPLHLIFLASVLFILFLSGACTPSHPQSTFDAAGPIAEDQRFLFLFIFWVAVAVFVIVVGALIFTVFRYRRRPGQGIPNQVHGNQPLEIAWTIVPAIILIVIAVPTVTTILDNSDIPDEGINVNVTGHQWWWEFDFPDHGGLITANELHIPAGEDIIFALDSGDVQHSFWVPKLGGKTDIFPMEGNRMWLRADEAGTFRGQCAELCGTSHARMRFRVIAHPTDTILCNADEHQPCPEESFESWVAAQQEMAVVPTAADVPANRGKNLFASNCAFCHTIRPAIAPGWPTLDKDNNIVVDSTGQPILLKGPDLTHFASRTTLAAGVLENDYSNVERWLQDPDDVKPANLMSGQAVIYRNPESSLSAADISELVAYLQSLK